MLSRATGRIKVLIEGDATDLQRAATKSEAAVGGINKKMLAAGALVAGAFAVDPIVDFAGTAVKEADRVADATGQIEAQLGPDLSRALLDRADDFSKLGQSEGDMLELEKRIIDIGAASGATDDQLAPMAEELSKAAGAMALIDTEGRDANYWIEQIGKSASTGSVRTLQELGVNLDTAAVEAQALADSGKASVEQLTAQDYWGARVKLIMEQLAPKIEDVATGTGDLEQKQTELNAKWETFTGEIGEPLAEQLEQILDFVLKGVDGWGALIGRLDEAKVPIDALTGSIKLLLVPFLALNGVIGESIRLLGEFFDTAGQKTTRFGGTAGPRAPGIGGSVNRVTVNVQGGSPETIEQAVRDAFRTTARRG